MTAVPFSSGCSHGIRCVFFVGRQISSVRTAVCERMPNWSRVITLRFKVLRRITEIQRSNYFKLPVLELVAYRYSLGNCIGLHVVAEIMVGILRDWRNDRGYEPVRRGGRYRGQNLFNWNTDFILAGWRKQIPRLCDFDDIFLKLVLNLHRERRERSESLQAVREVMKIRSLWSERESLVKFSHGIEQSLNQRKRKVCGLDKLVAKSNRDWLDGFIQKIRQIMVAVHILIHDSVAIVIFTAANLCCRHALGEDNTRAPE